MFAWSGMRAPLIRRPPDMSTYARHAWAVIALLATVGLASGNQKPDTVEIRVRILRAWNGKPWKGIKVTLCGVRASLTFPRSQNTIIACEYDAAWWRVKVDESLLVFKQRAVTDSTGVATFEVEQPLAPSLLFEAWQISGCAAHPEPFLPSAVVVQSGLVLEPGAWCKVKKRILDANKPVPGEIVLFALRPPGI
jgi:hypothetical protein